MYYFKLKNVHEFGENIAIYFYRKLYWNNFIYSFGFLCMLLIKPV